MEEIQANCSAELMDQISFIKDTGTYSKSDVEDFVKFVNYSNGRR